MWRTTPDGRVATRLDRPYRERVSPDLKLAQDPDADRLLSHDPFALLVGMLLDQQFPMERAFAGPALLAQRLGTPDRLDPAAIAALDPEVLRTAAQGPPAIHRYPGSMADRIQALAQIVVDQYGGDAAAIWTTGTGTEVLKRLAALPGFGQQKSKIFLALVAKQLDVKPRGWQQACFPYGRKGTRMSIADVTGPESLIKVRKWKQAQKAAAKAKG